MKILALADVESKGLWDFLDKDYLRSMDLILAAGDLTQVVSNFPPPKRLHPNTKSGLLFSFRVLTNTFHGVTMYLK